MGDQVTMERLIELKVGTELPEKVLRAWKTNISEKQEFREITSISNNTFSVKFPGYSDTPVKREGFIEFYN